MTNSATFNNIVGDLRAEDFDTIRGYIRDTVRAEWGGLIADLTARSYEPEMAEGPGLTENAPEDETVEAESPDEEGVEVPLGDLLGFLLGGPTRHPHLDISVSDLKVRFGR